MTLTQITTNGIKDGEILNTDINASAAIAGTKVTPAFGSQNLSTTGTAATGNLSVTGTSSFSSLMFINGGSRHSDFQTAYFGSGLDLQISHDSSNSKIKNKTGELQILANDANDVSAKFLSDGAVELYYDNSKKFETTTNGIKVIGESDATAGAIELRHSNGKKNSIGTHFASNAYDSRVEIGISDGSTSGGTNRVASFSYAGLSFGSDTASANRLDDYEEGTFTPSFANVDNSVITVNHYHYTKVGRLVHFEAKFTIGSNNDGSGFGFQLPFTHAGSRETVIPAISTRSGSTTTPFAFVVNANQSYAYAKALDGFSATHCEYVDFAGAIILVTGTFESN